MQILPLTIFANEVTNDATLELALSETEPANIDYEIEEERSAYSKTYLL